MGKNIFELQALARQLRFSLLEMSMKGKAPHLASSLSCVELIAAAYWSFLRIDPTRPDQRLRDRFILSKGHAITTLYAALAYRGFFSKELLQTFNCNGSCLPEHPTPHCIHGIEMATGSLGHGLPVGMGHALASKILNEPYRVMVLLGDGECNEGSVWEAAMFAPAHHLDNLIAIVDYNKWQATARSNETLQLEPLSDKWKAFGWHTYEVDGNDFEQILAVFQQIPASLGKPTAIVAHTVKGKGISFMEDNNHWHYRIPNEEEMAQAKEELQIS